MPAECLKNMEYGHDAQIKTFYLHQALEFVHNKTIVKIFSGPLSFWNSKGNIILNTYSYKIKV